MNEILDLRSDLVCRHRAVFHCGTGNSMELMPSAHTYERKMQTDHKFASFQKKKIKIPPAKRIYIHCRKIPCCLSFLYHVNDFCKHCHCSHQLFFLHLTHDAALSNSSRKVHIPEISISK